MKKLYARLFLLLIVLGVGTFATKASATTITQTCGTSGTLTSTGNWTAQRNDITQTVNTCRGATGGDYNFDYYSGSSWGNDQESTITASSTGFVSSALDSVYVIVRDSGPLNAENFYDLALRGLSTGNVSMVIYRAASGVIDNTSNLIGTSTNSTSYAAGDTFTLRVKGSTLTAYHNGVQVGPSFTDTHITSGSPGFGMFSNSSGNSVTSWKGTDNLTTTTALQYAHVYPYTSGNAISMPNSVTAGDLLVMGVDGGSSPIPTITVTGQGTWHTLKTSTDGNTSTWSELLYNLNATGGTGSISATLVGGSDYSVTVTEYHSSLTSPTWTVDSSLPNGTSFGNQTATTNDVTSAYSTTNASVIAMDWGDHVNDAANAAITPSSFIQMLHDTGAFTLFGFQLDGGAQSNIQSGWTKTNSTNTGTLTLGAFDATASVSASSNSLFSRVLFLGKVLINRSKVTF